MSAIYSAIIRAVDACLRRRTWLLALALGAFGVLVLIAFLVLQDFPNSGDEYGYLYEARTFAAGRLFNPAPALPEFLETRYVATVGARNFSMFPPGWPLLLAAALKMRVPLGLVNPILGTLTLMAVFALGRRLYGARVGLIAAALLCVCPFFLFTSASFFSHPLCALLLVLVAYFLVRTVEEDRPSFAAAAGACLAWAAVTRYYAAFLCALPLAVYFFSAWTSPPADDERPGAGRQRSHRAPARSRASLALALGCGAAGALPIVIAQLWYNRSVTGGWLSLTGAPNYAAHFFAPKWPLRGFDMLASHLVNFIAWTPPLLLFIYATTLARRHTRRHRALNLVLPAFVIGMFPYIERGGNQYGARFYYEALPFVALVSAAVLFEEGRWADKTVSARRTFGMLLVSLAVLPLMLVFHAAREHAVVWERNDLYRTVAQAGLTHAIVFLDGRVGGSRSIHVTDLTRNGIDPASADVIYALDRPDYDRFLARHPDRRSYRYRYDAATGVGALVPMAAGRR